MDELDEINDAALAEAIAKKKQELEALQVNIHVFHLTGAVYVDEYEYTPIASW